MSVSLLTVSPSPHVHEELTIPQVMRGVIYAMLPALMFSIYVFGWDALYVNLIAILSCLLFERLISEHLLGRPATLMDGSAIITGMLLAFNLPASLPWYIVIIGSAVAIGIGKMSFGGLGNNPFNPALVGRVFLLISFPVEMTTWPLTDAFGQVDATSGATILGILKDGLRTGESATVLLEQAPAYLDLFLGLHAGSLGEMSGLALVLGLAYMLYRKIITWHVPLSMIVSIFVLTGIFWLADPQRFADPIFHLLTGGVLLGAIFMATDYVTSPFTQRGMVIFGVGIGVITSLIRLFGSYPEGVSFAILIMNAFVPLINKYTKPKLYGAKAQNHE
ncbi:MAG: RnfABCDGE type electron transport complex subunit D [Cyclobacteriaceae bacterium]|nr:RnfABCDGE type electron transport complex subunit D [Cyclobacteriaceae bacterium HetDA_MAG_MS6]